MSCCAGDPQWFVDAAACTPDALALRASGSNTAKEGQQVISAIAADSDALGPVGAQQGLPSVDEDDTGPAEAASGTCSSTPNPAVAAIVTLGSPQRPPSTGVIPCWQTGSVSALLLFLSGVLHNFECRKRAEPTAPSTHIDPHSFVKIFVGTL